METLSVILRTHDGENVHKYGDRFVKASKQEIILRSLKSIIKSINTSGFAEDINLIVVDDHSPEETVNYIKEMLKYCAGSSKLINMDKSGNGNSMKECYELALAEKPNLLYLVEDDYIHEENAISVLCRSWAQFTKNLGDQPVVLSPVDDPVDYLPKAFNPTRIVNGPDRHWRQNTHTTYTMFMPKWILMHFWDKFMAFAQYDVIDGINEDNTINLIYKEENVFLFSPMPQLAVHLQYIEPVVGDWKRIWEENILRNISE